jgi:hypothetical protein
MGYINKILTFVSGKIFYPDATSPTGEWFFIVVGQ